MARLRPTHVISVLTFEEKIRVINFFKLLVEIDVRLPKTAKVKTGKRIKTKHSFSCCRGFGSQIIKYEPCSVKCPVMCCSA